MNAVRPTLIAAAAFAASTLALSACSLFSNPERDPQGVVNRKLSGMKVGDFVDRFGGTRVREENADGSVSFLWQSSLKQVAPGTMSPDDNLCRVRITADRAGVIVVSQIATDTVGEQSTSQCADIFR